MQRAREIPSHAIAFAPDAGISVSEITKRFPGDVVAVDRMTLDVRDGEFLALVGPSGCGKTTLLRMIAGLEEPTAGKIAIAGHDVTFADPRRRDVAMVFQNYSLYPHLTVRKNCAFGLRRRGHAKAEIAQRVDVVARAVGIEDLLDRKPGELSGGQCQRVAMARAIVRQPRAFLMDEPLSSVDPQLRSVLRTELARLHQQLGVTTIFVTHDQSDATTLGERIAVMRGGGLEQSGSAEELFNRPANVFVGSFVGAPAMNLARAQISDGHARIDGMSIPLRRDVLGSVPEGKEVIVGLRPGDFLVGGDPPYPRASFDIRPSIVQHLGSEIQVLFELDALGVEIDGNAPYSLGRAGDDAHFTARIGTEHRVVAGERLTLAVDPQRVYVFDPTSGTALGWPTR